MYAGKVARIQNWVTHVLKLIFRARKSDYLHVVYIFQIARFHRTVRQRQNETHFGFGRTPSFVRKSHLNYKCVINCGVMSEA